MIENDSSPDRMGPQPRTGFIEDVFCQRFNFFIVIFSLVMAGANTQVKLVSILGIGEALCVLVDLPLYRNYVKLILILRRIHKIPDHPGAVIGVETNTLGIRCHSGTVLFIIFRRCITGINRRPGIKTARYRTVAAQPEFDLCHGRDESGAFPV